MSYTMLITGARGFVGANLARRALEKGWDVHGIDLPDVERDSLEALRVDMGGRLSLFPVQDKKLSETIRRVRPNVVVHLAAEPIVQEAETHPWETFDTNVMGTVNVLQRCKNHRVPCIVASSDKAYGDGNVGFIETDPLCPKYPYDVSKACADLIAQAYLRTYDAPVIVTRGVNTYGPGDLNWTRLVPHTCRAAIRGERPRNHKPMWTVKREWIYVEDLCSAYLMLASNLMDLGTMFAKQLEGIVNIGGGVIASPSVIVPRILGFAGSDVEPILEDTTFHELGHEGVNSDRIRHLGWKPEWPLDRGLEKTVGWYRAWLEEQ